MYRVLRKQRDRIKMLRQERNLKIAERSDLRNRALALNPQIEAVKAELVKLCEASSEKSQTVKKLIEERQEIGKSIATKRQAINALKDSKRFMLDNCKGKKSEIMAADQEIYKIQADIRHIQGKGRKNEW